MKFKPGDLVWHTWMPDVDVGIDRRFMQGEIIDGPHVHPTDGNSGWGILWEDGKIINASEIYLLKIPPDEEEHGRKNKIKNKRPTEAA